MQKIITKTRALLAICAALVNTTLAASNMNGELTPLLYSIVVDRGGIKKGFCIYDLHEDVQNVIFGKLDCDEKSIDDIHGVMVGDVFEYDEENSDEDQDVIVEDDDSDGGDSSFEDEDFNSSLLPLMITSKQMFRNVNRYLLKRLLTEETFKFSRFMIKSGAYRLALLEDVAALPLSSCRYTEDLSFSERRRVLQLLRFLGYGKYATVPHVTRPVSLIIKVFLGTTEGRSLLALILLSMLWAAGTACVSTYLYSLDFIQWRSVLTAVFTNFSCLFSVFMLLMALFEMYDFADSHFCMRVKPRIDDDQPLIMPALFSCKCRC